MNRAQDIRPLLSENIDERISHIVDLLFIQLGWVTENWNYRGERSEAEELRPLVASVRLARDAKHELLELGYAHLAHHVEHLGNLCEWAITGPASKRAGIGGALNINISKIEKNPHWYIRPPQGEVA